MPSKYKKIIPGRTATPVQIGYLADHRQFIPTLARWHYQEWAYLRLDDSVGARTARLRDACRHTEIPTVVIAFTDYTLLGSAMLVAHDMDTRMDLSPWLAGVFVSPEHRQRGIGAALVQRVKRCTRARRPLALPLHSKHRTILFTTRLVGC